MSRRNAAVKRPVLPDPQFNSRLASMMISRLMKHGKKSTAQRILSDAFSLISERTGGNAVVPPIPTNPPRGFGDSPPGPINQGGASGDSCTRPL